jgi:hypothetical protein
MVKRLRLLTSNHLSVTALGLNPSSWILSCEEGIQLAYSHVGGSTLVPRNNAQDTRGLLLPLKLESHHLISTVFV